MSDSMGDVPWKYGPPPESLRQIYRKDKVAAVLIGGAMTVAVALSAGVILLALVGGASVLTWVAAILFAGFVLGGVAFTVRGT